MDRLIDVSMGNACVVRKTLAAMGLIDVLVVSANVGMAILVAILVSIVSLENVCVGLNQVAKANAQGLIAMLRLVSVSARKMLILAQTELSVIKKNAAIKVRLDRSLVR